MYIQLKNEFTKIQNEDRTDNQKIITLYADDQMLVEPERKYVEDYPGKHHMSLEQKQKTELLDKCSQ